MQSHPPSCQILLLTLRGLIFTHTFRRTHKLTLTTPPPPPPPPSSTPRHALLSQLRSPPPPPNPPYSPIPLTNPTLPFQPTPIPPQLQILPQHFKSTNSQFMDPTKFPMQFHRHSLQWRPTRYANQSRSTKPDRNSSFRFHLRYRIARENLSRIEFLIRYH